MTGTIGQGGNPEKRPAVSSLGALKLAVGVMGVLIVVGVAIIVVTMVQRLGGTSTVESIPRTVSTMSLPSFGEVALPLPLGAVIQDMEIDGRRLVLRLRLA